MAHFRADMLLATELLMFEVWAAGSLSVLYWGP